MRRRRRYLPAPEPMEHRSAPSLLVPVAPAPLLAPCDAGDDPPITQPPLPSTGPSGPGSSS